MALIAVAVYDTEENRRTEITKKAIDSLLQTVDRNKHRIIIVDNYSCKDTLDLYRDYIAASIDEGMRYPTMVMFQKENLGTARAINQAWKLRQPGEHCIKMDSDIIINYCGWVDELEEAIRRDPAIGQIGLKRKDCWEWPGHEHPDWRSELHMLPHKPGEPWQIVEKVKHVIGSCVMHSAALLDKVGYLYQPSLYGYDDVIMSHRTHLAGFYSCFLPHINIDHIDPGDTPYQGWKERHSAEQTKGVIDLVHEMYNGTKPIYYGAE
jgi:glycosyltransferase involved in cell wall biosynthesis